MNGKKRTLLLLLLLAALLTGAAFLYPRLAAGGPQAPQESTSSASSADAPAIPAPSFSMEDTAGNTVELSQLLDGRPAVLNFWASNCSPCKAEMPDFQSFYDLYGQEIQFIMVNVGDAMGDTRSDAEDYLEKAQLTLPIYYDLDFQGVTAYGLTGFPTTFFLDGSGNVDSYQPGMLSASLLQLGLHRIAPDLVPDPQEN